MQLTLPRLGESIVEGTVVAWRVGVGQSVQRGQTLVEIETDKATNEVPSPVDGLLEEVLVEAGQTVPVGTPLATLRPSTSSSPSQEGQKLVESIEATGAQSVPRLAPRPHGRRSSPAVRRRARLAGIDLETVRGTGPQGRVSLEDLELRGPSGSVPSASQPWPSVIPAPDDEVRPLGPRRLAIGRNLRTSLETAVHVFAVTEIDLGRVERDRKDRGLGLLPYVCRAVVEGLRACPDLNTTLQGEQLIRRRRINLGIATDTDAGLLVPVLHDADALSVEGLQARIAKLAEKARSGRLRPEEQAEGTFTISNPGRLGNLFGVSIIRPPEVAILRLGAAVKRPLVVQEDGEDRIVIRPVMAAALTYDHRVVDGAMGNRFLDGVRKRLEANQG